jgi:hypothetical protein
VPGVGMGSFTCGMGPGGIETARRNGGTEVSLERGAQSSKV